MGGEIIIGGFPVPCVPLIWVRCKKNLWRMKCPHRCVLRAGHAGALQSAIESCLKRTLLMPVLICFKLIPCRKQTSPPQIPTLLRSRPPVPGMHHVLRDATMKMVVFNRNLAFIIVRALSSQQKLTICPIPPLRESSKIAFASPACCFSYYNIALPGNKILWLLAIFTSLA